MKRLSTPLFAFVMLGLVSGCDKSEPPTASSALLTGTLKGRIVHYGSGDKADLPIPPGITTVTVEGRSISTTTDTLGRWTLNNLPTGTYNFEFSRPGFVSRREFGFQFVGGGTAYMPDYIALWKQTPVTVSNLRAVVVDTNERGQAERSLYVAGTLNAPSTFEHPNALLVIGQHDSLGINNRIGPLWFQQVSTFSESGGTPGVFESWIPISRLQGFTSGGTTRVLGYGHEIQSNYYNPELATTIYPNYTTPDTASFVMP